MYRARMDDEEYVVCELGGRRRLHARLTREEVCLCNNVYPAKPSRKKRKNRFPVSGRYGVVEQPDTSSRFGRISDSRTKYMIRVKNAGLFYNRAQQYRKIILDVRINPWAMFPALQLECAQPTGT